MASCSGEGLLSYPYPGMVLRRIDDATIAAGSAATARYDFELRLKIERAALSLSPPLPLFDVFCSTIWITPSRVLHPPSTNLNSNLAPAILCYSFLTINPVFKVERLGHGETRDEVPLHHVGDVLPGDEVYLAVPFGQELSQLPHLRPLLV